MVILLSGLLRACISGFMVQADSIGQLLSHPKAHVFICGDGARMAKDVHACLAGILESVCQLCAPDATARLADMTKAGRYVRDIWS